MLKQYNFKMEMAGNILANVVIQKILRIRSAV